MIFKDVARIYKMMQCYDNAEKNLESVESVSQLAELLEKSEGLERFTMSCMLNTYMVNEFYNKKDYNAANNSVAALVQEQPMFAEINDWLLVLGTNYLYECRCASSLLAPSTLDKIVLNRHSKSHEGIKDNVIVAYQDNDIQVTIGTHDNNSPAILKMKLDNEKSVYDLQLSIEDCSLIWATHPELNIYVLAKHHFNHLGRKFLDQVLHEEPEMYIAQVL